MIVAIVLKVAIRRGAGKGKRPAATGRRLAASICKTSVDKPGRRGTISRTMSSNQRHDGVRPRFCFLLASVHTGASVDLWRGVAREAEDLDVDLLVLPAGQAEMGDGLPDLNRAGFFARNSDALAIRSVRIRGQRGPEFDLGKASLGPLE